MDERALATLHAELRDEISQRLNVRGKSLGHAVRRAGRLMPAEARAAARDLAALEARLVHPTLAARTDPALIRQAAGRLRAGLSRYEPGARAARDRAFLMAEIGFKLALLIGAGLALLHWQGGV
ncbi:hypothetical protein [Roseicyclus marinus]|uniref:hypothetical protein n=1 Tax=Roseicyclus marinus TaxID=2161673 RepID=UPI00240EF8B3|nr:hypothetical protein [Roseicyclus marinus]MDG3041880.1 hypothetical protein [Roseicyclus marinus]